MPPRKRQPARPPHVAIRQTKLAIDCRDAIYGGRTRPFGRILRLTWTRLVAHYVRSRALTYHEVLRIAHDLGDGLRLQGAELRPDQATFDYGIRLEFSRRLVHATRAKEARLGPKDPGEYDRELRAARARAWIEAALRKWE